MLFNPDTSKPVQKDLFLGEMKHQTHLNISLNNIQVDGASCQKHLSILPDEKLNFKQHVDNVIMKTNKGISIIKKLKYSLPRKSLIAIYKAFLQPLIDYGDVIYDKHQNESFCENLESIQYKALLAVTGAIQSTSRVKIFKELGLESLK